MLGYIQKSDQLPSISHTMHTIGKDMKRILKFSFVLSNFVINQCLNYSLVAQTKYN